MVRQGAEFNAALQKCITGETSQNEWDSLVLLSKNVGAGAVCRSSIPGKVERKDYAGMCNTILDFAKISRIQNGKKVMLSCADPANNCRGVLRARKIEYDMCSAGIYPLNYGK